jgi:hypothetical protein
MKTELEIRKRLADLREKEERLTKATSTRNTMTKLEEYWNELEQIRGRIAVILWVLGTGGWDENNTAGT